MIPTGTPLRAHQSADRSTELRIDNGKIRAPLLSSGSAGCIDDAPDMQRRPSEVYPTDATLKAVISC